ncbi:hypothetical protein [Marinoscillum furvescens]|uniref:Uncharacterized protein n=1 Tax=Marinoscillum furvescens DSM 4134 TaxID=1122208 RepID=A0A3D9KXV9_MARFU|nr:hypothetical protein [Marinoscillum furvescens]RED92824.1 hypothetical protein C7460_12841 [Marinoscillum furvescens DSM 4134]
MKYTTIFMLLWMCHSLCGQTFDANSKVTGTLKTTEGKYEGLVDINLKLNQVLWSRDNSSKIFGARQIKEAKLQFPDGSQKIYVGHELGNDHYLFEALAYGKTIVLFKEGLTKDQVTGALYPPFFTIEKNKLKPLERKKDILEVFGGDSKWMHQFIKNRNLDLASKSDIEKAFDYYNGTFEATNPTSP